LAYGFVQGLSPDFGAVFDAKGITKINAAIYHLGWYRRGLTVYADKASGTLCEWHAAESKAPKVK